MADPGHAQRDPVLSFSHTFLLKSARVRSRRPQRVGAPPQILDPQLISILKWVTWIVSLQIKIEVISVTILLQSILGTLWYDEVAILVNGEICLDKQCVSSCHFLCLHSCSMTALKQSIHKPRYK